MKKILNYLSLFIAFSVLVFSCKKDETKAILVIGDAPVLTSTVSDSLTLLQANEANDAVSFNWSATTLDRTDVAPIEYNLEMVKSGKDWSTAQTTALASSLSNTFTVKAINTLALKMGLSANFPSKVDVRVKAFIPGSTTVKYSNVVSMIVTPYRTIVKYFFPQALRIAGNYQGWSPNSAPTLVSLDNDGKFVGYINFGTTASPEFKMVKDTAWTGDFGGSTGVLTSGGNNLTLPSGGVWLLKANTNDMTWSQVAISKFGLIGSATANGWNSDVTMTYDASTGNYTLSSVPLSVGEVKFRANDAWDLNYGDTGNNGSLEENGDNIPVTSAGNYDIVLGIGISGNWYYQIIKL